MTPLELIQFYEGRLFTDEDGHTHMLELLPPLPAATIDAVEQQLPCPLPTEMRNLLSFTRGFANGPVDWFEFIGLSETDALFFDRWGIPEIIPFAVPIAGDGFGNFWIVDLTSTSTTWGPIVFVCHDPPVLVYQANDLSTFIYETFRLWTPPHESALYYVHDDAANHIWKKHPGVQTIAECWASGDAELRAFADTLDESFLIVNLRHATVGDGYAWGRFGADTVNKRFGEQRIFAYQQRPSRWRQLFGKQQSS
jgi:hypothetical protein